MPSLKDRDTNVPSESIAANLAAADNSPRQQPVALEVPVTVNGARPLEGNDKREPFSESTKTVLVFGNGAVIRLGSAVAPGQLLFVTNERTKKEVICQVVRSKSGRSNSGYVEVEFTEPVSGFWGLRFPANHAALRSTTSLSDPESPTDEFLRSALETSAAAIRKTDSVKSEFNAASPDERFKTEPKSDERASSRANLLVNAPAAASMPKPEAARLQERLAALFAAEKQTTPAERPSSTAQSPDRKTLSETTAKPFEPSEAKSVVRTQPVLTTESQPAKPVSTLASRSRDASASSAEELKVPSWLQPLTRDTATSPAPEVPTAKTDSKPVVVEPKLAAEEKSESLRKSKPLKMAPVVGSGLLGQSAAPVASHHSKKGLSIAMAVGLLVVAVGARWYLLQPTGPALTNKSISGTQVPGSPALPATVQPSDTTPATDASTTASHPETLDESQAPADTTVRVVATPLPAPSKATSGPVPESASASSDTRASQQPAIVTERIPNSSARSSLSSDANSTGSVESEPKKLSLDNASLAKPKAKRRRQSADLAAPSLGDAAAPTVSSGASLGSGLVPSAAAQPAAPAPVTPVGGDVKTARLLSSVPPVYPPIAKSQHVAGDVRIDALIDANGRVSSMKVISGPPLLHQAAMDALRQWKYQAATLNGTAVPMHLTVTLQFHLQ